MRAGYDSGPKIPDTGKPVYIGVRLTELNSGVKRKYMLFGKVGDPDQGRLGLEARPKAFGIAAIDGAPIGGGETRIFVEAGGGEVIGADGHVAAE